LFILYEEKQIIPTIPYRLQYLIAYGEMEWGYNTVSATIPYRLQYFIAYGEMEWGYNTVSATIPYRLQYFIAYGEMECLVILRRNGMGIQYRIGYNTESPTAKLNV